VAVAYLVAVLSSADVAAMAVAQAVVVAQAVAVHRHAVVAEVLLAWFQVAWFQVAWLLPTPTVADQLTRLFHVEFTFLTELKFRFLTLLL
jgi:hypothetical protein